MKQMKQMLSIMFVLTFISGCASVGLQPAETFTDQLAYAWGVHTAVLQTIDQATQSGVLKSADAQRLLDQSDAATLLMNAAMTAHNIGDAATASNKLALATVALTRLQTYLNTLPGSK